MFYTYKDFISTSYSQVAKKKDTLGKRPGNELLKIEEHTEMPIGEYRWLGARPKEKPIAELPSHPKEVVLNYFEVNGGTQQGAKDNWVVSIDGTEYVVKKFDGQTTVTMRKAKPDFPITGIQAGSEI